MLKKAMDEEIDALKKNETWDIFYLPNKNDQWDANGFFQSNTRRMDGFVERYKA